MRWHGCSKLECKIIGEQCDETVFVVNAKLETSCKLVRRQESHASVLP